jgi:hypothetical protein
MAGTALVIGFAGVAASLPIDDFWLSIASGSALLDGAPIDRAVPLTWTPMRDGALNPQWAAQILFAAPGSIGAALALNAALIAIGLLLTAVRATSRAAGSAASGALLLVIAAIVPHLLARAQSFSIALLPAALILLERFATRWWLPLGYGLLMAVWANLHGAFVIGQLAALAYVLGGIFDRRPWRIPTATFVVSLIAPLANPVGVELIAYAYAQPGLDLIRQISVEWQPAYPWIPLTWIFWVQAGLLVAFRLRRGSRPPAAELVLGAALLLLAVSSIRHIPWFCLATATLLASDLAALMRGRTGWGAADGPAWLRAPSLRRILIGLALIAIAVQPIRPLLPPAIARVTPDAPVELVDQMSSQLPAGRTRVLNEQVWGGYIAYRLRDVVQTAMDGRIEVRDRATWQAYFDLMRGEGDPAAELADDSVEWALLAAERETLVERLTVAGWRTVATDAHGVLMRAPGG